MIAEKAKLIAPYGGDLVNLLTPSDQLADRMAYAGRCHRCR